MVSERLADALASLKALQDAGQRVIRSADLSRLHRERLVRAGYLQEVLKGWYLPARPEAGEPLDGSTAAWYAGMRDFVVGYCSARFGEQWHLAPEQSLQLRGGECTLPRQLQVWATAGNNQLVALPHGCSLFVYRARTLLPAVPDPDNQGIRLVNLVQGLVAVPASFYSQQPLAARVVLGMLDDESALLRSLLQGGHSVVAGRLVGALRAVGRSGMAERIVAAMQGAGYVVQAMSPFESQPAALASRPESPYVQRLRLSWAAMRETVVAAFPAPSAGGPQGSALLEEIDARHVADAYHSLSIEGYRVTVGLIDKVRRGQWQPDGEDRERRDAMAARGYFDAYSRVRAFVAGLHEGDAALRADTLHVALGQWYLALFSPSVQAGLLQAADLAGWRDTQVFIRGARHVPPPSAAVRECMPVLFELIASEPHPAVRAVLGHFLFVFIHPYMDGNGRLARFLMNAMLVTGGYGWTIIPVQQRQAYMDALEAASSAGDIGPFARFVAALLQQQSTEPPFAG
ncbi:MAG: Fic family protein [Lautropia sp.]|nr:Fic family protein [Lautropia sp.]